MGTDYLDMLRQEEKKAAAKIQDATTASQRKITKVKEEARELIIRSRKAAEDEGEKLLSASVAKNREDIRDRRDVGRKSTEKEISTYSKSIDVAVDLIVGRIVSGK